MICQTPARRWKGEANGNASFLRLVLILGFYRAMRPFVFPFVCGEVRQGRWFTGGVLSHAGREALIVDDPVDCLSWSLGDDQRQRSIDKC